MKDFKKDLFEMFFWFYLLLSGLVFYSSWPTNTPPTKEPVELHRNRFFENCGTPNKIESRPPIYRADIKHIKWN